MGLVVEHINKWFGQLHVITDLSMEVKEGSIFGFLGANGAGKTTTMRMILDIIRPESGHIIWNGIDVREIPRRNWG
ncbi:MAG: ATP-binding cassette domain-containing protein, partial [Chloroflexi bacterium]|nr:ATP-binding cassette domain-containing protein [Chloroflexota bacterium]